MGLAHSPRIVTDGLVLALDAGNTKSYPGSGTSWSDLSGNSNTGTLTNGPTYSSDDGGSIVFDGVDDYVSLGQQINEDISQHKDCSFNVWFNISNDTIDSTIFSTPTLTPNIPFILWYDVSVSSKSNTGPSDIGGGSTNALVVMVTDSSSEFRIASGNNIISGNNWYNVCVVLNPTNDIFYTYLNGEVVASFNSSTCNGIKTFTDNFIIGSVSNGRLNGNIAQVSIYNRALTADEVSQNFNALRGRFGI